MQALFLPMYLLKCSFGKLMLSDNIYPEKEVEHFKETPKLRSRLKLFPVMANSFYLYAALFQKQECST